MLKSKTKSIIHSKARKANMHAKDAIKKQKINPT